MIINNSPIELATIKNEIEGANQIGILTHNNPDGDAMGSSLALFQCLTKLNKTARLITPNQHPEYLQWIKGNDSVIIGDQNKDFAIDYLSNCDVLIMLDFNTLSRIDWLEPHIQKSEAIKILIDHHPNPSNVCNYVISDPRMSSTSELLFHVLDALGWKTIIDKDIAESIYCGILTDTGCFNYNSSDPSTFRVVSELLNIGINKDKVYSKIYNNYSESRMRLLGHALSNGMTHFPEFNTAYIALTKEDLIKYNFQAGDTEGFVNYPLSIKGTKFTALFIEKENMIKISFRSTGNFPANEFSSNHFNGGGHLNAAGGNSNLSLNECIEKFVSLLPKYKDLLS